MRHTFSSWTALLACHSALACSCVDLPPVDGEIARSDAVFAGRVVKSVVERRVAEPGQSSHEKVLVCYFSDIDPIKGVDPAKKEVIVVTSFHGSECGFPFSVGTKYLVYGSVFRGELLTDICRRTRLLDSEGRKEVEEARKLVRK